MNAATSTGGQFTAGARTDERDCRRLLLDVAGRLERNAWTVAHYVNGRGAHLSENVKAERVTGEGQHALALSLFGAKELDASYVAPDGLHLRTTYWQGWHTLKVGPLDAPSGDDFADWEPGAKFTEIQRQLTARGRPWLVGGFTNWQRVMLVVVAGILCAHDSGSAADVRACTDARDWWESRTC